MLEPNKRSKAGRSALSVPADREALKLLLRQIVREAESLVEIPQKVAEAILAGRVGDRQRAADLVELAFGETCMRMDPEQFGKESLDDTE